jgi:hypothetical protein
MGFTIPTLLQVRGVGDDDEECIWYAEAVGRIVKDGEYYYEGYYLVPSKTNPDYLVYDETYEHIPEASVMVRLGVRSEGYPMAWSKMGILMKDTDEGPHFIKIGDPQVDTGSDDDEDIGSVDSYSTESDGSDISDLIDDSEEPTCANTEFTRRLNEDFREWVPKDEKERRVKDFISSLEHRAARDMDERTF